MEMPPDFPLSNPLDSWGVWIFALCIGIVYGVRSYFGGPECRSGKSLKGKVALVTGVGEWSIGEQVAIDFAQRGAKVILGVRRPDRGPDLVAAIQKRAASSAVRWIPLDLLSFQSIDAFVDDVAASEDRLDLLVHSAGVMLPPFALSEEGFESQFQVNFLGPYKLTRGLLPLLKAAASSSKEGESRVIFVTCRAFQLAERLDLGLARHVAESEVKPGPAYARSKLATTMAGSALARRWADDAVRVHLVHPGVANTSHGRNLPMLKNWMLKITFYPFLWLFTKSPWHGAQTVIFCSVAETLKGVSGKYYVDLFEQPLEGLAGDAEEAERLLAMADGWIEEVKKDEVKNEEVQSASE